MTTLALAVLCTAVGGDEGLSDALKKFTAGTNYTFKVSAKTEGGGGKGGGGGVFECMTDGGVTYAKSRGTEAFLQSGKVVYKGQDGKWTLLAQPEKGAKPDKGMREVMALRGIRIPHEELNGFDAKLKDVKSDKDGESTVFSGTLTDDAAKELGAMGRKGGQGTYAGSAKIWVDANGNVSKFEITINVKAKMKNKDVDLTTTRTVEISAIGSTAKIEIPEEAKKLLE